MFVLRKNSRDNDAVTLRINGDVFFFKTKTYVCNVLLAKGQIWVKRSLSV